MRSSWCVATRGHRRLCVKVPEPSCERGGIIAAAYLAQFYPRDIAEFMPISGELRLIVGYARTLLPPDPTRSGAMLPIADKQTLPGGDIGQRQRRQQQLKVFTVRGSLAV